MVSVELPHPTSTTAGHTHQSWPAVELFLWHGLFTKWEDCSVLAWKVAMKYPNSTEIDDWRRLVSPSINVAGWLSLLFGVVVGGLQTLIHVMLYNARARGVTLDAVYAIFFLWCFWGAVSIGYIVSARLVRHDIRAGMIAASIFALGHISVILLIFTELGWL